MEEFDVRASTLGKVHVCSRDSSLELALEVLSGQADRDRLPVETSKQEGLARRAKR